MKKLVILLLFAILLTSCKTSPIGKNLLRVAQSGDTGAYETVTNVYRTSFVDLPEDYIVRAMLYPTYFYKDDRIYFLCNNFITISQEEYKFTEINALYSFDTHGNNAEMIPLGISEDINNGVFSGVNIIKASILPDGNFIILAWDYSISQTVFITFSPKGVLIDTIAIENIPELRVYDVGDMAVNDDGDVVIATKDSLYIVKNNQTSAVRINAKFNSNMPALGVNDGTIYFYDSSNTINVYTVNIDEQKIDKYNINIPENIKSQPGNSTYAYIGPGYDIFYKTYKGMYGYNAGEDEAVLLADWGNSDIYEGNIYSSGLRVISIISPETILAFSNDFLSPNSSSKITLLNRIPDDEVKPKMLISIAYTVLPINFTLLMQLAYRFNQTNDNYRIVFKDYWQYATTNNYNLPTEKLNLDIGTGIIPDIMFWLYNTNIRSYVNKDLLVNLYDYLDSREDIIGCVKSSCEIDDKLYTLPLCFTVQTLVGKSSLVGKNPYWTIGEMLKLYNDIPDDAYLLSWDGQWVFYNILQASIGDYIDYEKGTCDFTSDDLINLLKFSKSYSTDPALKNNSDGYLHLRILEAVKNNKLYLDRINLNNLKSYILLKHKYDDDIVFKGYPTKSSNGSLISSLFSLGITTTSKVKNGAWEFIQYLMSDEIQNSEALNDLGFPVKTSALRTMLDKAPNMYYYLDPNNNYIFGRTEQDDYYSRTMNELRITKAETDYIFNFLNGLEIRNKNDETIMTIIREEVEIFWAGQYTAEKCAENIQNRVYIYVNEQR
ncbi:MAG: extracellular solute-binding protein [Oscillospiraceae bacterium]|nr:extracellular solute-binding protein [Oscillospiraceae bacterium]